MSRRPPRSPLFPYPTLFRSRDTHLLQDGVGVAVHVAVAVIEADDAQVLARRAAPGHHVQRVPHRGELVTRRGHPLRSEEHTSELQSRQYLVCRLLLEKKKHD